MPYRECKVYSDGSHYIAIPPSKKLYRPRRKQKEEPITVKDETLATDDSAAAVKAIPVTDGKFPDNPVNEGKAVRQTTRKALFDEIYVKYADMTSPLRKRQKRKSAIFPTFR